MLDTTPADIERKAFLLRKRDPVKEIGPDKIKFKASNSIERIQDVLDKQGQSTYLPEHNLPKYNTNLASRSRLLSPLNYNFNSSKISHNASPLRHMDS